MTRVNRPKKAASPQLRVLTQAQLEIAVEGEQEINSQKRGTKTQKLPHENNQPWKGGCKRPAGAWGPRRWRVAYYDL